MHRWLSLVLMGLLLVACGSQSTLEDAAAPLPVEVTEVVATNTAPEGGVGAVYMTISNTGSDELTLTGVRTEINAAVGLHDSLAAEEGSAGQDMVMFPAGDIVIPAGERLALEATAYHVMLMQLEEPLAVGERFDVTLIFEEGEVTVEAVVQ